MSDSRKIKLLLFIVDGNNKVGWPVVTQSGLSHRRASLKN